MEKILGIDLGTNSIGWAIREISIENENQIIDKGVLTFEKGVAEDKSGEHPMVQKRTECRGKRRNFQAEKYRKFALLECLIDNNMCPLTIDELNGWRNYKKGIGRQYPQSPKFIEWLRYDFDGDGKTDFERLGFSKHESYYLFRSLIVDEHKTAIFKKEPYIIGRVLYQIAQRRGYYDLDETDETEKDVISKTIMKGGGESKASGANEIEPYIDKYKTLGAALYEMQKEKNFRVRERYNLRSRFEAEIKEICKTQDIENLTSKILSAIIWQRPLRGQKGLVGVCTFEQNKKRCPTSHPLYEEYRTWVFINNLKIISLKNDVSEEELLDFKTNVVYPEFYKAGDFKLLTLKKKIEKHGYIISSKFLDDTKVVNALFLYRIREIFGENWQIETGWLNLQNNKVKTVNYNIEDLWHLHFNKTANIETGESAFNFIKRFCIEKLKLDETKANEFAKIALPQGYATISINAIKKILPFLKKGFIYSEAIYLANLPKVLGVKEINEEIINHFSTEVKNLISQNNIERKFIQATNNLISEQLNGDHRFGMDIDYKLEEQDENDINNALIEVYGNTSWNSIDNDLKIKAKEFVSVHYLSFLQKNINVKNSYLKTERLHNKIFNWLANTYNLATDRIKYLWHPSEQETYAKAPEKNGIKYLGSPEPISKGFKNPMAIKTLHYLKKLINYLISINKIDEDTRIVVEIARELNDANKRKAITKWQKDKEIENTNYKKQIQVINRECNTNFDSENKSIINKIRLWEEQSRMCIYTGKTINLCDVLNGGKYDFEHTIPSSMSFDNELKNLTIADKTYNQQIKGKKIPTQCPNFDTEYKGYKPIIDTLQAIYGKYMEVEKIGKYGKKTYSYKFERIIALEKQYQEWKDKKSDDKEIKNNIIIKKHYLKMGLDYWRYKLNTFTLKEYKLGFRNNQLKDTQTISKYALPFLKTVFKRVEVQKGTITADFRKIYEIQTKLEKKERTKHIHHAIDAAVLTLIPPAALRDKILFKYNEANDLNLSYHEKPRNWKNYTSNFIKNLEEEILINHLIENRALNHTEKQVRKRGKIQFVKEKLPNGKWQYKIDSNNAKIPLMANGATIRGQLHKDSYFGAIKQGGEIILVKRQFISDFTNIEGCKNIVDIKIKELVTNELLKRMESGMSFDKAKLAPIPFHKGDEIIKKVRCRVAAGKGYLNTDKAIKIRAHDFKSKHDYKQNVYAQNNENTFCLYYEKKINDKIIRCFENIALFELSQLGFKHENDFFKEKYFNTIKHGKGKKEIEIPLVMILKPGTKCIFYHENIEELKELSKIELLKRLFRIFKFNSIGITTYVYLQNHLEARKNDELGNGDGNFNSKIYQSRLMLNPSKFNCAIGDKDFEISIDGTINWKEHN